MNTHLHAQAVDLDRDGRKELVLSGQDAVGHVFTPAKDGAAVEFLGRRIPGFDGEHLLADLEGNNVWELVFAGGEQGVGHSRALKF